MNRYSRKNIVTTSILLLLLLTIFPPISSAEHVNPKCCTYPAKSGGIKIQFLLEACAVPGETARGLIPYFDCQSFFLGTIEAYRRLKVYIPKENQTCIPENITTKDVLELIWRAYPNWDIPAHRDATEVILEVLEKEYSCSKPSGRQKTIK
jgi:hypothetical protein